MVTGNEASSITEEHTARFHVHNLGCKVNRVESDTIMATLIHAGARHVDLRDASVIIINTCTVTAEADAKARKAVRHAINAAPEARVIVTGCAAAINPADFTEMSKNVIVEASKEEAVRQAKAMLYLGATYERGISAVRFGEGFRSRAGIKIQDGCDNACAFCIVHVARGPVWSRPMPDALDEVKTAAEAGVHEVVFTGINLGKYEDLPKLLKCALEETDELRIRLSSIEPTDVSDDLIDIIARSEGRICRHLHIPLQSGCEKTLQEMGRVYHANQFAELVGKIREEIPEIAITTDVIAGFPGETDEDFKESIEFCSEMAFSKIHVFRYSRRPETPAAQRIDQVPPQIIAKRASKLRQLADAMRAHEAQKRVGTTEMLLVEEGGSVTSESYFSCVSAEDERTQGVLRPGQLVCARIVDAVDDELYFRHVR